MPQSSHPRRFNSSISGRPRDVGYQPRSEDLTHRFLTIPVLCRRRDTGSREVSDRVRRIVSNPFSRSVKLRAIINTNHELSSEYLPSAKRLPTLGS